MCMLQGYFVIFFVHINRDSVVHKVPGTARYQEGQMYTTLTLCVDRQCFEPITRKSQRSNLIIAPRLTLYIVLVHMGHETTKYD